MKMHIEYEVICDECEGRRFNPETLEIRYRKKSVFDVLEMTIRDKERMPPEPMDATLSFSLGG